MQNLITILLIITISLIPISKSTACPYVVKGEISDERPLAYQDCLTQCFVNMSFENSGVFLYSGCYNESIHNTSTVFLSETREGVLNSLIWKGFFNQKETSLKLALLKMTQKKEDEHTAMISMLIPGFMILVCCTVLMFWQIKYLNDGVLY